MRRCILNFSFSANSALFLANSGSSLMLITATPFEVVLVPFCAKANCSCRRASASSSSSVEDWTASEAVMWLDRRKSPAAS